MKEMRLLFIGAGNLGGQMLDLLLRLPGKHRFLVGGRHLEALRLRVNLSLLAAIQLGYQPEVECVFLDLKNSEQTTMVLAQFKPDLIVSAATSQPLGATSGLPSALAKRLTMAPIAPRLPSALSLLYPLMKAVRGAQLAHSPQVVNAIFPDMAHPILQQVGLAPSTGIGDLANNVPALRLSIAQTLHVPVEQVDVRLIMAHWVSYWMSRTSVETAPSHFTALVNDTDQTALLDQQTLLAALPTTFKRLGGETGLLMTAASALVMCQAMMLDQRTITHAPGPNGLPGGYPVQVDAHGVEVLLPAGLSLEEAKMINEAGLQLDGIARIETDGTVLFTDEAVSLYRDLLGYTCARLPLSEIELWAQELQRCYEQARET